MSNVKPFPDKLDRLSKVEGRLPSGGEPPDNGRMEHRLTEVEKAIIRIDGRFDRMEDRLQRIEVAVGNFKWQVGGASLAAVVAVALASWAATYSVQQMTVSTFAAALTAAQAAQQAQTPPHPPAPAASR